MEKHMNGRRRVVVCKLCSICCTWMNLHYAQHKHVYLCVCAVQQSRLYININIHTYALHWHISGQLRRKTIHTHTHHKYTHTLDLQHQDSMRTSRNHYTPQASVFKLISSCASWHGEENDKKENIVRWVLIWNYSHLLIFTKQPTLECCYKNFLFWGLF